MKINMGITDKNFKKEVIEKSKEIPLIVDFWAEWCMPCLSLSNVLDEVIKDFKGKFILIKVNVDKIPKISEKYKIMSIPNVKIFNGGKVIDEFVGVIPEDSVRNFLKKNATRFN